MGATLLGAFFTVAWSLENVGFDDKSRQKVQWRIGGKGTPGRPNYRLTFGNDLRKYEIIVQPGIWSDDAESADDANRQGEF